MIPGKELKIALVGNPNSGKTSLFNALTGLRQKVGNFAGVTIDKKWGSCETAAGTKLNVLDLPGTYSIYPKSQDEEITFQVLVDSKSADRPDVAVLVVDAASLKRNLLLASQLIDLETPVVIALNMLDVASEQGANIDHKKLEKELGVPVIPINARTDTGLGDLQVAVESLDLEGKHSFLDLHALRSSFRFNTYADFLAASFPELLVGQSAISDADAAEIKKLQTRDTLLRYEKLEKILEGVIKRDKTVKSRSVQIDKVLLHRYWGFLIFLGVLFIVFQSIFSLAQYPMDLIENGFVWLGNNLNSILPDSWLSRLLVEGVLAGVGGVVIFIPQIMILFGFITILEDSGYMARVSFLLDRMMRAMGMHGKSIVPLVSGVACAVPAIMATRGISNWKDRIITIMVTPLMSCSARLPVYTLLISLIIPEKYIFGVFNLQGLTLLAMYLLGIVGAVVVAMVLNLYY